MAESWRDRRKREAREMDSAVRELLAAMPSLSDAELRQRVDALAQRPLFSEFTWLWGRALHARAGAALRSLVSARFSQLALDARARPFEPWRGPTAEALERWLADVDAADDVELTRRLYEWRLAASGKRRDATWREDVTRRLSSAGSPAARAMELAKVDVAWMTLDAVTARSLYDVDAVLARPFILRHLPWFGPLGQKREAWDGLLEATKRDEAFHFALYRRIVDDARWRTDVLAFALSIADPIRLDEELERRHPVVASHGRTAEVFAELARMRGRDVVPYLLRHVAAIAPRWGVLGMREGRGLPELLALAHERRWLDLWAALLRTSATPALFDAEVRRLVASTTTHEADARLRLGRVAGAGVEANFPGISFAHVQPLEDETAVAMYDRFPDLLRGPFRLHVAPSWRGAYPRLVRLAIERGDAELVDFFASRVAMLASDRHDSGGLAKVVEALSVHYETLDDAAFVSRASNALSRTPAFAIWSYDELLRRNRLARLLFERSTALYVSEPRAVRDLLESPQIHVQALALRVLAGPDARAQEAAAASAELLQATLLRPLHRRTRLLAFAALENAIRSDESTAAFLLRRMRDALALPDERYPKDELVALIAKTLHVWPTLRWPNEAPRVHGEVRA